MNIKAIQSEIESGLLNESERLELSKCNIDFYRGQFEPYSIITGPQRRFGRTRTVEQIYEDPRFPRDILFMQRAVNVMTQHLYANGPARSFPDAPELSKWLQSNYKSGGVDGLFQEADRLAMAADVSAIQVIGTGRVHKPVMFRLWGADQFCVWVDSTDPTIPAAVATIDIYDQTRRLRLWTADRLLTYETDKLLPGQTANGTAYRLVDDEENTYQCIPFAFVHVSPPTTDFQTPGPGDHLRRANEYLNASLTETSENLRLAGKPIVTIFGAGEWLPPTPIRPGDIWNPQSANRDAAGNGIEPSINYLQSDTAYVEAEWADLQGFIDSSLQMIGIPPSTIRMVQSAAKSGVAIVGEQLPLIIWATSRQRPFAIYEQDLARVAIQVGKTELERLSAPLGFLDPDQAENLSLRWPSMVPKIPLYGSAQDDADQWDLTYGLISRIQVTMRRYNLSRDEAIAHLEQVAKDLEEEKSRILLPPLPTPSVSQTANVTDSASDEE